MFNIFNRCATRGGAAILEEMFRNPLSDVHAINRRSNIISSFANFSFPFDTNLFDAAEPYLDNTDERTKLAAREESVTKKIGNLIATDNEMAAIFKGIEALVKILKHARQFVASLNDQAAYAEEKKNIADIINNLQFISVLESRERLSQSEYSDFDILFRFRARNSIKKLLRHIYYLDVYISIARVAKANNFNYASCFPRRQNQVKIVGVFHPMVKGAVANDLYMPGEKNIIFLTGANMAGKSTLMKSISIALYLAHMGFPVPAKSMEFSAFDAIYTTINLPDNLGAGASHFYAEVLRLKKVAFELSQDKKLFIVFDELFRGTNVKDAYEATIEIVKAFSVKTDSFFIISTHIIEAGEILREQIKSLDFLFMPTRMNGSKPEYPYKVEKGITNDRHGMVIINNEGILDILEKGVREKQLV